MPNVYGYELKDGLKRNKEDVTKISTYSRYWCILSHAQCESNISIGQLLQLRSPMHVLANIPPSRAGFG